MCCRVKNINKGALRQTECYKSTGSGQICGPAPISHLHRMVTTETMVYQDLSLALCSLLGLLQ